jgi:hypothetical protein
VAHPVTPQSSPPAGQSAWSAQVACTLQLELPIGQALAHDVDAAAVAQLPVQAAIAPAGSATSSRRPMRIIHFFTISSP